MLSVNACLPEIESSLRRKLEVTSIADLPDPPPFSVPSHAEFRELHRSNKISVAAPYDPGAMDLFASLVSQSFTTFFHGFLLVFQRVAISL